MIDSEVPYRPNCVVACAWCRQVWFTGERDKCPGCGRPDHADNELMIDYRKVDTEDH